MNRAALPSFTFSNACRKNSRKTNILFDRKQRQNYFDKYDGSNESTVDEHKVSLNLKSLKL